jgi:hypothetical protein
LGETLHNPQEYGKKKDENRNGNRYEWMRMEEHEDDVTKLDGCSSAIPFCFFSLLMWKNKIHHPNHKFGLNIRKTLLPV